MLVRPLLEVDVVQQAHHGPEVPALAIAQLVGIPGHDALYGQSVENVEGFLVVLAQQRHSLVSGVQHSSLLSYVIFVQHKTCPRAHIISSALR